MKPITSFVAVLWLASVAIGQTTQPSTQPQGDADLRKIVRALQQQVVTLKIKLADAEKKLADVTRDRDGKALKLDAAAPPAAGTVPMYEIGKENNPDDYGIMMHGSKLRPKNPVSAAKNLKVGQSEQEVMVFLGAYNEEETTAQNRTVRWLYLQKSMIVTVVFVNDKVADFSVIRN